MSGCSYRSSQLAHEKLFGPLHLLISGLDKENDEDDFLLNTLQQHKSFQQLINEADRVAVRNSNSTNTEILEQETLTSEPNEVILSNYVLNPQVTKKPLKIHEVVVKNKERPIRRKVVKSKGIKQVQKHNINDKTEKKKNKIQINVHISDRVVPVRAIASIPRQLHIRRNVISPARALPPRIRFGPVEGVCCKLFPCEVDKLLFEASANHKPLFLMRKDEDSITHINVTDKDESNWLSLLPLGNENTANVWLYEEDNKIYGITIKTIFSRTPLALGYSKKYADDYNMPQDSPILDLEEEQLKRWWCFECEVSLGSAARIHKHNTIYHHKTNKLSRRKYRCLNCLRLFSSLKALLRHRTLICKKKPDKVICASTVESVTTETCASTVESVTTETCASTVESVTTETCASTVESVTTETCASTVESVTTETCASTVESVTTETCASTVESVTTETCASTVESVTTETCASTVESVTTETFASTVEYVSTETLPGSSTPLITEENRIPSDESFENYSALDLSTNLFDPDRICNINLDISGSLKTDIEFNLYSDSGGLKFDNLDKNDELYYHDKSDSQNAVKNDELIMLLCVYCQKTITKAKKRRHLRECSARRFECKCGKIFRKKEKLAEHVYSEHTSKIEEEPKKEGKDLPYKCDICGLQFKRRGMLINHLWRVHKKTSTAVPAVRRVLHYPCSACPKIYCSAIKRDIHMKRHHPGECVRAAPIEGELRVYKPAQCPGCPRQYSTPSKLQQHMKAKHPELASS